MLKLYKSIIMKIDKYELKNPLVSSVFKLFLVLIVFTLLLKKFLTLYELINVDLSTEMITVLASLLGATVGGIISYLTTTGSILKTNRVKSAIINKKSIYEPIYIEFKQLLEDLEKKEIIYISRDARYRTIGSTSLEFWTRVKKDTRIFQIPEYLSKDVVEMENALDMHLKQIKLLKNTVFVEFESMLNTKGYYIFENRDNVRDFFSVEKIIRREKDILLEDFFERKFFGVPEISDEDKTVINAVFNHYIQNKMDLSEYETQRDLLVNKLKNCLEVIELIIKTITNKYERQNNLF